MNSIVKRYLSKFFASTSRASTVTSSNETHTHYFKLPFVGPFSSIAQRRIRCLTQRFCKNLEIKLVFAPYKIKNLFSVKDVIPKTLRSCVVYKFSCAGCSACYVGKTNRHLATRVKCAAFFDQIFPWSFWSIDQLDGPLHICLEFCHVVFFQLCCVVLCCVVLCCDSCCVLVFSPLCCVVLCCDLLCVSFLSFPCCVALCCVAICYYIRLRFFYYHLPSFHHRTEQLDRQTMASPARPARPARPTPQHLARLPSCVLRTQTTYFSV